MIHPTDMETLFQHALAPRDWSWQAELAYYLHVAAWLEDLDKSPRYFATPRAHCQHLNDVDFAREILAGGLGLEILKANREARETERRRAALVVIRSRKPRKPRTRLIDMYAASILHPDAR